MKPTLIYQIQQKIKETISQYKMIPPQGRVLLAVSGGADSMVMMDIISELMDQMDFQTRVCHVNHNLRGKESMADERLVIKHSEPYVLPLTVRRFDLDEIEYVKAGNIEERARELRYKKLIHTAIEFDCTPILTAHTMSDQAETVLYRMIRSSGISGLTGILPIRRDMEVAIARPLLQLSRADVLQYAKDANLQYCHDSMNDDEAYARVKIRKYFLPMLAEMNPQVDEAFANLSQIARDEEDFWQQYLNSKSERIGQGTPDNPIDRQVFLNLMRAEQNRYLRFIAKQDNLDISRKQHDQIITLINSKQPQGEITLGDEYQFYRRYDACFFAKAEQKIPQISEIEIPIPGTIKIDEMGLEIQTEIYDANVTPINQNDPWLECFDADLVIEPVRVRNRIEGDSIVPLGMSGRKKVKKILQEEKITKEERDNIPIICFGDEIAWVGGVSISDKFKITAETIKILQMRVIKATM